MDNRYCDHDSVANQAIVEFNSITTRPKRILFSLCTACSNQTAVIILQSAETALPISLCPICLASRPKTPALNHKTSLLDRLSLEMHLPLVSTVLCMAVNLLYIWRLQIFSATWLFPTYLFQLPSACDQKFHGTIHLPTLHPLLGTSREPGF